MQNIFDRWSQLRSQGEVKTAQTLLQEALSDPANVQQAMACKGIEYCSSGHWGQAILPLLQACMEPAEWGYHALLAKALIELGRNDLAVNFLQYGLRRQPHNSQLRAMYWQAAARVLPSHQIASEARAFLEEASDPVERQTLTALLGALSSQPEAATSGQTKARLGPAVSGLLIDGECGKVVDILVPVFGGYRHTRRCLESVIESLAANQTPATVIVLDDAGGELALANYLKQLAESGQIQLHRHPHNLGFIDNINYGMRLNPGHDVVWLNSDTRVHDNWLDRLHRVAYSQLRVASVTPWSNNGELMSLTGAMVAGPMPDAESLAAIDDLVANLNLPPVEIPAGCGFCFYLRREAIEDVGLLNNTDLKRGYGEETEWSMRARKRGYVHLAATDTFVGHEGGNSFGLEKALRAYQNNRWIRQAHPDIDDWFEQHPGRAQLDEARHAIQSARLPELLAWSRQQSVRLDVLPDFIAGRFEERETQRPAITLSYTRGQEATKVLISAPTSPPWQLEFQLPEQAEALQSVLGAVIPVVSRVDVIDGAAGLPTALQACIEPANTTPAVANHVRPIALPTLNRKQLAGKAWLIADPLHDPTLREAWLKLARDLGAENLASPHRQTVLCFVAPGEVANELRATGAAYQLPRLEGLPIHEQIKLPHIKGAVTLGADEGERIYPAQLAGRCGLELFCLFQPTTQT